MKKFFILFFVFISFQTNSHEIKPAVVDIIIFDGSLSIELAINAETVLADVDSSTYQDTNKSPESLIYDQFRALSDMELAKIINDQSIKFINKIKVVDESGSLSPRLEKIDIIPEENLELPRETKLKFMSLIDSDSLTLQFDKFIGDVVIRQFSDTSKQTVIYASYLKPAEVSEPLSKTLPSSFVQTAVDYLVLGIEHIVPKGLDHILFVIGIFFYSLRLKSLIGQVTMFTIAHSLTLILASLNLIYIPAFIIEPLIALSISYIAFENILQKKLSLNSALSRYIIIFIFGLIHGLGFAFVLGDIGLNTSQLILSLLSFNLGVEVAQIGIIILLFILMIVPSRQPWYSLYIQFPISGIIGLIGLYWFIERVFF